LGGGEIKEKLGKLFNKKLTRKKYKVKKMNINQGET